jgi:Fungal specific transcription factor domain
VHFHPFYPLLHRPTFEESLDAKLHLYDHTFGSTILAVCALGSRYSDDPRVLYGGATSKQSAGWKYFNQIEFVLRKFVDSPSVYVLQVYSVRL